VVILIEKGCDVFTTRNCVRRYGRFGDVSPMFRMRWIVCWGTAEIIMAYKNATLPARLTPIQVPPAGTSIPERTFPSVRPGASSAEAVEARPLVLPRGKSCHVAGSAGRSRYSSRLAHRILVAHNVPQRIIATLLQHVRMHT